MDQTAKEIADLPLEMLALEKATINRAIEMTGFKQSCVLGAEYDAMARLTGSLREAIERVIEKGIKQASIWKGEAT